MNPGWARGSAGAGEVCYLVGRYPAVSHTFIDREIQAVREAGVDVFTVSLRRVPEEQLLTGHDRLESERTWCVLPPSPGLLIGSHLRALIRSPRRYLRTLKKALGLGAPGLQGFVWKAFYWGEAVMVSEVLRTRRISHIHAHFANSASWVAMLSSELAECTWSFTMHGPTEFDDVGYFALADKVESASFVACIGDYCRSQLMKVSPAETWAKLVVVRCGVDIERYPEDSLQREVGENFAILSVGRLVADKGQRVLIQALNELALRGVAFTATLVGDGPDREWLEETVAAAGLTGRVTFEGNVGQDILPTLYRRSDLFVLASFAEGIPVVLMEAMASGTPVIATSIMGIGELVQDGVTGQLVPPGRADLLAEQLFAAATEAPDPAVIRAARDRVETAFSHPGAAAPLIERFVALTGR